MVAGFRRCAAAWLLCRPTRPATTAHALICFPASVRPPPNAAGPHIRPATAVPTNMSYEPLVVGCGNISPRGPAVTRPEALRRTPHSALLAWLQGQPGGTLHRQRQVRTLTRPRRHSSLKSSLQPALGFFLLIADAAHDGRAGLLRRILVSASLLRWPRRLHRTKGFRPLQERDRLCLKNAGGL